MMRLAPEDLQRTPLAALERLARALGLAIRHPPGATDGQRRRALVHAVLRAEKAMSRAPRGSVR